MYSQKDGSSKVMNFCCTLYIIRIAYIYMSSKASQQVTHPCVKNLFMI